MEIQQAETQLNAIFQRLHTNNQTGFKQILGCIFLNWKSELNTDVFFVLMSSRVTMSLNINSKQMCEVIIITNRNDVKIDKKHINSNGVDNE